MPEALAVEIALMARAESQRLSVEERAEVDALRRRVSGEVKKRWPGI
jgi:hypothetical protein